MFVVLKSTIVIDTEITNVISKRYRYEFYATAELSAFCVVDIYSAVIGLSR